MPKTNCDYSRTVIYKIVCNDLVITYCYVGNTTDFVNRKNQHKFRCNTESNRHYNTYVYQYIRENGGWNNWSMIEIEKYLCNDGNEARSRERYWLEQMNSTLNIQIPNRSKVEYYNDNKEKIKIAHDEYYNKNKETIDTYKKEYDKINKIELRAKAHEKHNCECGGNFIHGCRARHYKTKKHIDYINSLEV